MTEAHRGGESTARAPDASVSDIVVSIVAPAYNESENLTDLVVQIHETMEVVDRYNPFEVIIVDDGSTDDSVDTLFHINRLYPTVRYISLARNFGQSAALKAGIDHARGKYVVTIDADLQNDPNDIPMLLDRLREGYGCVSGWRQDRHDSLLKRIPSGIQTPLAKLTGPDINDFGCTLKAYDGEAIRSVDLYGEGHRYIPARVYKNGYDVTEMPVNHRERENGSSRYGTGRLIRGFVDLLFHIYWFRFSARPGHFLGGLGFVILGVGLAIGGHAAFNRIIFNESLLPHLPRMIAAVGMAIFGLQLLLFGLLAETMTKLYYSGRQPYRVSERRGFSNDPEPSGEK